MSPVATSAARKKVNNWLEVCSIDPRFVDARSAVIIIRSNTSLLDEPFGHPPVFFLMLSATSCQRHPEPGMLEWGES